MSKHTDSGEFSLDIDAACEVSMTELPTCSGEEGSAARLIASSVLFLIYMFI